MPSSPPAPTLREQLDGITAAIPEPIGVRIDAGVAEIEASQAAPGLAVGDRAPDFTLPDALGRPLSLADLLAEGPAVVTFYRGEWCPYCNLQLHALQAALPAIRELGASLVAISPQAPDHSLSLTEKHALAFPVLSDLDQVIRSYRVQFTLAGDLEDLQVNVFQNDPADQNADHSRSLPVPAVFVIDQDSVVRAAFVSADWRIRAEPADIIAALHALQPAYASNTDARIGNASGAKSVSEERDATGHPSVLAPGAGRASETVVAAALTGHFPNGSEFRGLSLYTVGDGRAAEVRHAQIGEPPAVFGRSLTRSLVSRQPQQLKPLLLGCSVEAVSVAKTRGVESEVLPIWPQPAIRRSLHMWS